jgi:hypothetical protein
MNRQFDLFYKVHFCAVCLLHKEFQPLKLFMEWILPLFGSETSVFLYIVKKLRIEVYKTVILPDLFGCGSSCVTSRK